MSHQETTSLSADSEVTVLLEASRETTAVLQRPSTPAPAGGTPETTTTQNEVAGRKGREKPGSNMSESSKQLNRKSEPRTPCPPTSKAPMKGTKTQSPNTVKKEKSKEAASIHIPSPPSTAKAKRAGLSPSSANRGPRSVTVVSSPSKGKGKVVRQLKFSASSDGNVVPVTGILPLKSDASAAKPTDYGSTTVNESSESKHSLDTVVSQGIVRRDQPTSKSETRMPETEVSSEQYSIPDLPVGAKEPMDSTMISPSSNAGSPMSKTLSLRRFRRSLSEVYPCNFNVFARGRRASEIPSSTNSVDCLKDLNTDLRDQLTRLRSQLEAQVGHIKQAQWQKVVHIRQMRQQEQQRCAVALNEQRSRLEKEKSRELDLLREQLLQKAESDLQKLTRFKDAEINKLKLELESKDAMLQRLLGENRHARVKLNIDDRKSKLLDELKELRQAKKDLEESLTNANFAERNFSNDLRKHSASFESELAKVKREAQIENGQLIEQLKNKDKIISQLEKDLGHQWGAAQFAALERRRGEGGPLPPGGSTPSHPLRALPDGSECPDTLLWTPTSASETEGVEDVWSKLLEGNSLSKQDLLFQLKDPKDRTKELLEKCRSFLQKNKELTAQNRAFQESNERANQEFKKAQELLEHSKLQVLHLSRQLSHVKMEKNNLEQQARGLDRLREEITEDKKIINTLRKACSDKDRRIELMQHRKKRRRVLGSAEKQKFQSAGLRETYYGYEEDSKTPESDQSLSNSIASSSTISDEDIWDDELSREEIERNYQRLVQEHMELQKIHALLQRQTGNMLDPQREHMDKTALQNDLFSAQCRIEHLEKLVSEIGEGEMKQLLMEREAILEANRHSEEKARNLENRYRQLQKELTKAEERSEELEFRLMEMEQCEERDQETNSSSWDVSSTSQTLEDGLSISAPTESQEADHLWQEVHQEMEQLRQELAILLKGKGKEAEAVLKKLDQMKETERKMEGLEIMARELQVKVISLQQENTNLQDKLLMMEESQPGKGSHSASLTAAKERKENLELKATEESQGDIDPKLSTEREHLLGELESWKAQCHTLKRELDALTHGQPGQSKPDSSSFQKVQMPMLYSSASEQHSQPPLPPMQGYDKKSSHRKSKARSEDDPTMSKRRKSSRDHETSGWRSRKLKKMKSEGDLIAENEYKPVMKSSKLVHDFPAADDRLDEREEMKRKIHFLEGKVLALKKDRNELMKQVKEGIEDKNTNGENIQMLKDRITYLERELDLLHKENVALGEQLRQRSDEFQYQRDDLHPRISELEEYCEDLQERLHGSEMVERQLREKLKFVEGNIDDAESNELAMREQCRQLLTSDLEAKKQIQALQKTGQELKDIVLEKEFVEQALRDKVDFLQKAEAASVKRIEELEQIEKELREQLEQRSDGRGQKQKDAHKIQELKHQMTFLQKDNQALTARVAELEENEETLRENWRRVADEDFNRTQCLEEKVKMLETLNRELKSKLTDAQEYFVINTVPQLDTSLAAELAESQSGSQTLSDDELDGVIPIGSIDKNNETEAEKKILKEKMRKLERQLSEVSELKNTKIESLQEQLVGLRETEIKLSETISEMEMTERELRAKLALYESSEVTVEKMLKYQNKIEELRTSQESLLDQLESMENQEMSMQEKMQEMERTLRGKIVTLEVEMKKFKQKELRNAGRIRDLEKQESSLTAKVEQQAEKENNLYMKINSLMEELKSTKAALEKAKEQLEEKEEKVRQVKLLEVKLLEIEMDYGKKTNELNTKLRHQEEEFRQKDSANEEKVRTLEGEVARRDAQEKEQRKQWENEMAQMNSNAESAVSGLHTDLNKINAERDNLISQVTDLTATVEGLESTKTMLEKELRSLRDEVERLSNIVNEKETSISHLSTEVEDEREKCQKAEEKANLLESQLAQEKHKVSETEEKLQDLKSEIESKMTDMNSFVAEKESEQQHQLESLQNELEMKESRVKELEVQLKHEIETVERLQSEKDQLKYEASQAKAVFTEGALKLKNYSDDLLSTLDKEMHQKVNVMNEKLKRVQGSMMVLGGRLADDHSKGIEFEKEKASIISEWEHKWASLVEEQSSKESELQNRVMFLDNQLQQEVMEKEVQQSSFQQVSQEKEAVSKSEIDCLQHEVEAHKRELIVKLSELESKNKEHCELSLKLSELRHSHKALQMDFDHSKESFIDTEKKLKSQLSEKEEKLNQSENVVETLTEEINQLRDSLQEKDSFLRKLSDDKDLIVKERDEESERLHAEVSHKSHLETELTERCKEMEEIKQQLENLQTEFKTLQLDIEDKNFQLKQYVEEEEERNAQLQRAHDKCMKISQELSNATDNIKENDNLISEQKQSLSSQSSIIKEIKDKLEQKEQELEKLTSECQVSESQHLSQLSEHQHNLVKYTENIKQLEDSLEQKDQAIQEKDQTYKQIQLELEDLSLRLKDRDQKLQQAESQVADVTMKLKQMENRYRELESKCASLEVTVEERYAMAQDAKKVLAKKEIQCKEMEKQLEKAEKSIDALQGEISAGSEDSKSLTQTLQSKDKKLEQLHSEVQGLKKDLEINSQEYSVLEAKFIKIKEEHTSSEKQYEQEKDKVNTTENCLLETEKECQTLQEKVQDCQKYIKQLEDHQSELKDNLVSLQSTCKEKEAKIQILNRSLEEYETACQEKNARVNTLESELNELEKINSQEKEQVKLLHEQFSKSCTDVNLLQEQLNKSCTDVNHLKASLEDTTTQANTEKKDKDETKSQLEMMTTQLEKARQEVDNLNTDLAFIRNEVQEKEKHLIESQQKLASMEQKQTEYRLTCEDMKSQLDAAQSLCEEQSNTLQQVEGTLHQTQAELDGHKAQLEQVVLDGQSSQEKWQETLKNYSDSKLKINELEKVLSEKESEIISLNNQVLGLDQTLKQVTSERDALLNSNENMNSEIQGREGEMKSLTSEIDTLSSSLKLRQGENDALEMTIKELQGEVSSANSKSFELNNSNQSLSVELADLRKQYGDLHPKFQDLEVSLTRCCQERDDIKREVTALKSEKNVLEDENQLLQKELDNASKEFDNLRVSCEQSKTNIEKRVHEMAIEKRQLEENYEKQTNSLDEFKQRIAASHEREKEATLVVMELNQIKDSLVTLTVTNKELEQTKASLLSENEGLKKELEPYQMRSKTDSQNGGEIVSEQDIQVSVASSLQTSRPRKNLPPDASNRVDEEIRVDHVEHLSREIDAFKLRDDSSEQKIFTLEKAVEEAKEKEGHMNRRLNELEAIEKQLKEQIVDIELTVIIPLETENQELKDEIEIVRQERDEAISKISSWDDEVNGVDAVESAHQRLEEALVQMEELEKKNEILLGDITRLESEKENLVKAVAELEASVIEKDEKFDCLQEETDRLLEVEKKVAVLEESETRLMDRVLDLEEREQGLTQELEKIVNDNEKLLNDEQQSKLGDLEEKLKYLEEKNQVLQDAEGHYMDKVMELEELVERLKSQLSSQQSVVPADVSLEVSVECNNSLSVSTQTSVPFQSNITSGANVHDSNVDTLEMNMSLLSLPQEENLIIETDVVSLQTQLMESEKSHKDILSQSQEKDTKITYLEEKLELLRDSEANLMERLLEMEEKIATLKTAMSKASSDFDTKIEHLQEENDFLAGNVENYQKMYKEEKMRSNDLQDRLMEDSAHLAELTRTQQELSDTQKMVQEIQCEYEEQLSERLSDESKLKEELCSLDTRYHQVEQELAAKCQREIELVLRIDTLERSEKDLKIRVESLMKGEEDESLLSDSGLSGDDPRSRQDATHSRENSLPIEAPIFKTSTASISLSSQPRHHIQQVKTDHQTRPQSAPPQNPLEHHHSQPAGDENQRNLIFVVERLQQREESLKDKLQELTAQVNDHSPARLKELEARNLDLETRLRDAEEQKAALLANVSNQTTSVNLVSAQQEFSQDLLSVVGRRGLTREGEEEDVVGDKELDRSFSSVHSQSSVTMLEKPEDVLMQRIRELEGLDKHNKNQLSELEKDREVLHEIARKDKASIHDLNVKIRELQLAERSLKEQVANLEVSENSLFSKCEELEAIRGQLEDRVHELEIHERRLRELVRKLKLDEERWLSKSGGFETAVAELSANEQQLKRLLQDVEMEKGGLSERTEYLEARVRELESVETSLLSRVQNYETNEVSLQNRLVLLENSETASRSKSSELEILNKDLTQRMKKVSDENAMMSQHLSQLHGQIQELDRRLLSSRDSELAFKQHVESLQKNESLLQKKVREYELREIDSQSQVRELEQHLEINKDKIAALQRSENRLKYRVQELEGLGAPIPGELTPSQRQNIPQKLEDCQKRIVVLQSQVENLQLQLRQALNTTSQSQPAQKEDDDYKDDNNNVTIATDEYRQLHAKAAMLDEIQYQNEELEAVNEQLNDTILQLRQGKGACGHEVEIEVLKRRINSLKTFIEKLKSSLSEGQATSLSDPDHDSGPQGDTLPARNLQVLESERVLQSVRGLHHDGKADTTSKHGGAHPGGQVAVEETMMQTQATQRMAAPPQGSTFDPYTAGVKTEPTSKFLEEPHWKAIEARKPNVADDSRGGVKVTAEREARTAMSSPRKQHSSSPEVEEVTLGLNLLSESEQSSHYKASLNDTDSSCSPVAPPRRARAKRMSKNFDQKASSGTESGTEPAFSKTTATVIAANHPKHFDNDKSLPLLAHANSSTPRKGYDSPAPLSRFGEDSFYLPSSAQEGVDSLDDDEAPPLPVSGPPGIEGFEPAMSQCSSETSVSMPHARRDSADSMDNSTSGMSIRERIAMIEKNLRSDTQASSIGSRDDDDQTSFWKRKSSEYSRQVDTLDKENKFIKEDINRLEKELEEKRRYINTLEVWLSGTEELLRNKNKSTDREMVEQLQLELAKLRKELKQAGYRSEDALLDPAALMTELEHRDKEILSKRNEIDALSHEVKRWQKESRNIEGMRRTALDSLRQLEKEVVGLQDAEQKLAEAHTQLHKLKGQYENKRMDLQNVIMEKEDVEFAMKSVILERDGLKVELRKVEQGRDELKPQVEELSKKMEELTTKAAKSSTLQDQLNTLNSMLLQRTDKTREVYEENLNLRDRINDSEGELSRYRTLCDDFNNLSARYDEMEQFKNQALAMVQPLQLKVERLMNKCKEKDALLRRLGSELRRGLHRPSSALEELTRLERAMVSEEYNMENSEEIRNGALSPRSDHHHITRARSVSMDELNFSLSDSDSVHSATSPNVSPSRRQRPTPYVNNRPRSAETVSSGLRSQQRRAHGRSHWNPRAQMSSVPQPQVYKGQFVAIADYDPGLFSQSGRPKLELLLREGDQVTVTGPMDRFGYCEAEVSGRTGLVPAIYLQPASQQTAVNGNTNQSSVIHLNHSPVGHGETHLISQQEYGFNGPSGRENTSSHPLDGLDTPDPPHHLHIKGVTGNSLMLAWLPPKLDLRGCSKGFALKGYKIYVNNQEYEQGTDPHCCEVVVKNLNLMYPVQLAVQSICAEGHVSPRTELVFEGMVSMIDADGQPGGQIELDTDLSSVLNSVQYKRGHKKTVIALYDYNPEQQSPHDYTAFELAFQAGDVISVYGEPRPDGFFHGEIDSKRGLIPACFVEDVPSTRRPFRDGSNDVVHTSSKA